MPICWANVSAMATAGTESRWAKSPGRRERNEELVTGRCVINPWWWSFFNASVGVSRQLGWSGAHYKGNKLSRGANIKHPITCRDCAPEAAPERIALDTSLVFFVWIISRGTRLTATMGTATLLPNVMSHVSASCMSIRVVNLYVVMHATAPYDQSSGNSDQISLTRALKDLDKFMVRSCAVVTMNAPFPFILSSWHVAIGDYRPRTSR